MKKFCIRIVSTPTTTQCKTNKDLLDRLIFVLKNCIPCTGKDTTTHPCGRLKGLILVKYLACYDISEKETPHILAFFTDLTNAFSPIDSRFRMDLAYTSYHFDKLPYLEKLYLLMRYGLDLDFETMMYVTSVYGSQFVAIVNSAEAYARATFNK